MDDLEELFDAYLVAMYDQSKLIFKTFISSPEMTQETFDTVYANLQKIGERLDQLTEEPTVQSFLANSSAMLADHGFSPDHAVNAEVVAILQNILDSYRQCGS
jgi:DNA-binding ferritin-like protein